MEKKACGLIAPNSREEKAVFPCTSIFLPRAVSSVPTSGRAPSQPLPLSPFLFGERVWSGPSGQPRDPWEARSISGQRQVGRHLPSCLWRRKNPSLGPRGIYLCQAGNWRAQRGATACCSQEARSLPARVTSLAGITEPQQPQSQAVQWSKMSDLLARVAGVCVPGGGKTGVQSSAASLLTSQDDHVGEADIPRDASVPSEGKGS